MLKSVALPQNASDDVEQFENLTAGSDGTTNLYYKYLGIVMTLKNLLEAGKAAGHRNSNYE